MSGQAIEALVFDPGGVIVAHDDRVMHRALLPTLDVVARR